MPQISVKPWGPSWLNIRPDVEIMWRCFFRAWGGRTRDSSLSGKTSNRQISWSFEAARLDIIMILSLWHLPGILRALLPRCLSNLIAIGKVLTRLSWASYQIRKTAGCACAGNAGNVFPCRWLQRKPLVSDPGMHHDTCVAHVPWCMSGSLTHGGGENVPGIPGACAPTILPIW